MRIEKIIKELRVSNILKNGIEEFAQVQFDSRKVKKGDLFVAIRGTLTDGHQYINDVLQKGASVVVCEQIPENASSTSCWIQVKNASVALAKIAGVIYNKPSQELKLVGVTGTNGKTTIATSLYQLTQALGYKAGLLSTIKNMVGEVSFEATHTTADALAINKLLREMVDAGCDYCFMEVSSHAIHQNRIEGLKFKGGIFTNLTHDHLDYHKTFKEYLNSKKAFFDTLPSDSFSLTNADDRNGMVMLQNTKSRKKNYSLTSLADYRAKILEHHFDGMLLQINNNELWTRLIGRFNASNLLAVYGSMCELGFSNEELLPVISNLQSVEGRFETFRSNNDITAIVDYAHTPDALKNVLTTINDILPTGSRIITVVGAGGNRDKTKRPKMAAIAVEYSKKVILTSDNPRNENPSDIIDDMMEGIENNLRYSIIRNIERKEAIKTAVMLAEPGDVVLVAGKGHETYQEINGVKHHFDDREIINELFKAIN